MKLPTPKAVIFDWDNTLVNTWPIIHKALNATFREWNLREWTIEETMDRVAKSMRDSFPVIFGEDWKKAGDRYRQHYRANHLNELEQLPGAEDVLNRMHERGLHMVLVSNKLGPSLREEVEHMGWNPFFKNIVGSADAPNDKPHCDPVHMAFDKSGIMPGPDVWFIGDSEVDLECALNTGCTAILYGPSAKTHSKRTDTHFHGFPYHAYVYDHQDMLKLLNG